LALRVPPSHSSAPLYLGVDDVGLHPRTTDTYRLARATAFILLATTLDVPNFLDRGNAARYVLLLIPLGVLALNRLRAPSSYLRTPAASDIPLLLLWPIGLAGTLVGLSIFLPMSLAFTYLGTVEDITERETEILLRVLAWIGSLYIGLNAVVNAGLAPGVGANQYRNASLLFMALGFAGTVILRQWVRLAVLIALEAFVFVSYPSGTTLLVYVAMLLTFTMTAPRPSRARPFFIAILTVAAAIFLVLNFSKGVALTGDYFAVVGKNNADSTRLQAWTDGVRRFQESPLIGNVFSEAGVTTVIRPGGRGEFQIPFHNDYVYFLASGGLVGIGLLVWWIVATEVTVLRRYGDLLANGLTGRSALLRALLVAFNAFFVTSAFNPSLMGMSRSAGVFAVYALMMALWPPRPARPAA
jgi:O-antigen ligase